MTDSAIQVAKKVVISLIKSPTYPDPPPRLDQELEEFFAQSRILKKHDIFHIQRILDSSVYYQFKVVAVEPVELEEVSFRINQAQTTLVQNERSITDSWTWINKNERVEKILGNQLQQIEKAIKFYDRYHKSSESSGCPLPVMWLHGPSGSGKTRCVESLCAKLSLHLCRVNSVNLAGESASAVEKRIEIFLQQSISYGPCIILFKSFNFLFKLKDINEFNKRIVSSFFQQIARLRRPTSSDVPFFFVICTTSSSQAIDSSVKSYINYELEMPSLTEIERVQLLKQEFNLSDEFVENQSFRDVVLKKTSGLFYGEMQTLSDLIRINIPSIKNDQLTPEQFVETFQTCSFFKNRKFQQENQLNIDSTISWKDVGGLSDIKQLITDTILLPLKYPDLFSSSSLAKPKLNLTRSGILLYGPPGTGKTLLAKAISNECGLNFLSVKGPELLDMYVGQTELNVRNLFEKARLNSPCILFFDELDSLAPIRGRAGDSGGVMDRVVSQLLTEIDGLDKYSETGQHGGSEGTNRSSQIFLIGATNRPDLIDASLLRPGRFDKLMYVPIAQSHQERLNIFNALIRKLPVDQNFDSSSFVEKCPASLSGADFYAITNKARQHALKRLIKQFESSRDEWTTQVDEIHLTSQDFDQALIHFEPTLNETAMLAYERYFSNYSNK